MPEGLATFPSIIPRRRKPIHNRRAPLARPTTTNGRASTWHGPHPAPGARHSFAPVPVPAALAPARATATPADVVVIESDDDSDASTDDDSDATTTISALLADLVGSDEDLKERAQQGHNVTILAYPIDDLKNATDVRLGAFVRLDDKAVPDVDDVKANYIDDAIISFHIKYRLSLLPPPRRALVYQFDTIFMSHLRKGYNDVARWLSRVDFFAMDLLVVPIHHSEHCGTRGNEEATHRHTY
ncbi:SUMO1 sentrin specific peptidase 1 [Blastocladiella emersonii ATCC 22665]|nr:SUMO1 sentrin specific peptidase 1 [Blastocladiella emersonii ATCC 22665]